mmetsp:Transcript_7716/g.11951  ORF Transcript_7716/g.11951 Transcript_7716/m.11951 type:complete len:614 (+) Transcript_7716:54-1895(+)
MDSPLLGQGNEEEKPPKSELKDRDEENKFNHRDSEESDDDEEEEENEDETLPAKSLNVIKEIISRHYGLLLCTTVFGASIGFIVYLFVSYDVWIAILAILGFIVGLVLDAKTFNSEQRTTLMTDYEPTEEEAQMLQNKWSRSQDDEFYIQSDFCSPLKGVYRGSCRVYRKEGSGAINFEKKALKRVEHYSGFEIGGGIASFIGFLLSLVHTLVFDLFSNWFIATLFVMFCTILFGLIGCIIERELRKWQYVPPINVCITKRDSIALHDISHVSSVTFGYHVRAMSIADESLVEKAAIAWFKLVAGLFYAFYLVVKYICYAFWINSAFTLCVFVSVSLGLLFTVHITKDDRLLDAAMWCLICSALLAIVCCIFVSPWYRKEINIGSLSIQQLQTQRIEEGKQRKLLLVFVVCTVVLSVASFLVVWVAGSIDNLSNKYFDADKYSSNVWDQMVCKESRGTSFPFGDIASAMFNGENKEESSVQEENTTSLCDPESVNYEFLAVAVLLLCILWYLLLATSFWWNQNDQYQTRFTVKVKKRQKKHWTQYSYVYIYRKSDIDTSWSIFKKCYVIELKDGDAKELQHYLNNVCQWYQEEKSLKRDLTAIIKQIAEIAKK